MTRNWHNEKVEKILAAIVFAVIMIVICGIVILARMYLPCSWFPLYEAPVRCLP